MRYLDFFDRVKNWAKTHNETIEGVVSSATNKRVSRNVYQGWRKRKTLPSGEFCYEIAQYMNVSTDWLISGKDFESQKEDKAVALSSERQATPPTGTANFCGAKTENGEEYNKRMEKLIKNRSFYTPVARLELIRKIIDLDDETFMNVAMRMQTLLNPRFLGKDGNNDMPPPVFV